jgi:predicted ATPase/DNA-binding CsgD family transcriptional regulator
MSEALPATSDHGGTAIGATPVPLTPLLGRDREMAAVHAMLDAEDVRLVTLTGTGGIGKTRLAVEIAVMMTPDFAHGARFVSLASVRDAELVPATVARACGVRTRGGLPASAALIEALHDRHLLLILDNLEHLIEHVAPWIAELLVACPRLHLLATSRVPLRITGEQRYTLEPLALPERSADPTFAHIAQSSAVQLFVQRARSVDLAFDLDVTSAPAIGEICRRLDGLPLAIELAAARISLLTPADILARLSQPLALLTGFRRDAPERHQSLHRAIAWSHDLLSPEAQWLFRHLAVFLGGIALDAVEFVVASRSETSPGSTPLGLLEELVDHALLRQQAGAGGVSRFTMLDTMREFGMECLELASEDVRAREVHAQWSLRFSRQFLRELRQARYLPWLDRVEEELPNLRAATSWLIAQDRVEDAADLSSNINVARHIRGYSAETARVFDELLRHERLQRPTLARAKVLHGRAGALHLSAEHGRARQMFEEALTLFRHFGERDWVAWTHLMLGHLHRVNDELEMARSAYDEVLKLATATGSAWDMGAALMNLGVVAMVAGDLDRAAELQCEALEVSRALDDIWIMAFAHLYLGQIVLDRGDDERAGELLDTAQRLFSQVGAKLDAPKVHLVLAHLADKRGDVAAAQALLERGLVAAREIGETEYIARALMERGRLALRHLEPKAAGRHLQEALRLFWSMGQQSGMANCLSGLGELALHAKKPREAAVLAETADMLVVRTGNVRGFAPFAAEHAKLTSSIAEVVGRGVLGEVRAEIRSQDINAVMASAIAVADELAQAVERAGQVGLIETTGLSERELEVLRFLAEGLTNQEIADALFVSRRTVSSHVDHILTKLDARSRTAAVAFAIRSGLA